MSEVPKLEHFKKNTVPEMINFFIIVFKKMIFLSSPKGTPHDRCRRTMIKTTLQLQWKPMEIGDVPQKWMNRPLVFMVFHGFSRLVSKNKVSDVPRNDQCFFILKKNEFLMLTEGYPPRPVSQNYEKNTLPWKPMELGGVREKKCVKFCKELSLLHV